jgi:hypothetical protein
VEELSTIINRAEGEGGITGLSITRRGMKLNHLFFVDDSLLFCKTKVPELLCLQKVLEIYEKVSEQKLNKEKTSLFFSRNTNMEDRRNILQVAGVGSTQWYEKYLGLPALIGRSWTKSFEGLKGKIWEKMHG